MLDQGPIALSELGPEESVSRRFGLSEGSGESAKTRLIDEGNHLN